MRQYRVHKDEWELTQHNHVAQCYVQTGAVALAAAEVCRPDTAAAERRCLPPSAWATAHRYEGSRYGARHSGQSRPAL